MKSIVPVVLFWLVLIAILVAMASFDRLIRWLHAKKKEEWLALGSPTGYLFRPDGISFWRSDLKKTGLAQRWMFTSPAWISENIELRRALWVYRSAGLCALAGMLAFWFALSL